MASLSSNPLSTYHLGSNRQPLTLAAEPVIGFSHGEGFFVDQPANAYPGLVKIMAEPYRNPATFERINWLRQQMTWSSTLPWPVEVVYERNQFAGYWTSSVNGVSRLTEWLSSFPADSAFRHRLRFCQNLAQAVGAAHALRCILGNLTISSLLVQPNREVQVLNLDTVQVTNADGTLLFPPQLEFNDHVPPEATAWQDNPFVLTPTWDYYSLAALFREILVGENVWPELNSAIERGLNENPALRPTPEAWLTILDGPPPPPEILTFSATPIRVDPGEPVWVRWSTKNVEHVQLLGPGAPYDDLPPEGETTLFPEKTTTYTLVVPGWETQVEVFVNEPPPPLPLPEIAFEVTPTEVLAGQPITLHWKTTHAEQRSLSGPDVPTGAVAPEGERVVKPRKAGTFIYTFWAGNAVGSDERRVQVQVRKTSWLWLWMLLLTLAVLGLGLWAVLPSGEGEAPESEVIPPPIATPRAASPRIASFRVNPKQFRAGETAILTWEVENAGTASIRLEGPNAKPFDRPSVGQTTTLASLPPGTHTYTLRVGDVSEGVEITVWERSPPDEPVAEEPEPLVPEATQPVRIVAFASDLETVQPGQTVVLRWIVENARRVELFGPGGSMGMVPATGSHAVNPARTALYRLQADEVKRKIFVTVTRSNSITRVLSPLPCGNGLWGYYDGTRLVIPCQFERAGPFNEQGEATVKFQGQNRVIDRRGDFTDN